jgi:hypothetical protein
MILIAMVKGCAVTHANPLCKYQWLNVEKYRLSNNWFSVGRYKTILLKL